MGLLPIIAKCLFLKNEYDWEKAAAMSTPVMVRVLREGIPKPKGGKDSRYFTMPNKKLCELLAKLYGIES